MAYASLDTSIVLRLLLLDLPDKVAEIDNFIASQDSGSLVLEDAVLFEVVWILGGPVYDLTRHSISQALVQITDIKQIRCNRALLFKVLPLYVKHPKLSFIDICLAVYAELNKAAPLLTLDKHLAKTLPNARFLTQAAG
ncbi:MAG: PIN domain-containing protein [Candidatus Saccharimonadales bacterium]